MAVRFNKFSHRQTFCLLLDLACCKTAILSKTESNRIDQKRGGTVKYSTRNFFIQAIIINRKKINDFKQIGPFKKYTTSNVRIEHLKERVGQNWNLLNRGED